MPAASSIVGVPHTSLPRHPPTPRLRELFSGRVVMLAGWSEQDADVIEAGDKTVLWLPLAHACMIQRFLSDGVVRMPTEVQTWLYALAFGVLGTLAAVAARGRIEAAVLVTLGLGACTVSGETPARSAIFFTVVRA